MKRPQKANELRGLRFTDAASIRTPPGEEIRVIRQCVERQKQRRATGEDVAPCQGQKRPVLAAKCGAAGAEP